MMRNFIRAAALAFVAASPLAGGASAQQPAAEPPSKPVAQTPVKQFEAAIQIAEFGREVRDPLFLIAAARVIIAVGSSPGEDIGVEGDVAADLKSAAPDLPPKPERPRREISDVLLMEARLMARGDPAILAAIDATVAQGSRGTQAGPHTHDFRLQARRYVMQNEIFERGSLAEAAIAGDGDTDVDLYVYDASGNLICESTKRGDKEYCSWSPRWTGTFQIKVQNLGNVYNDVRLAVN